MSQKLCSICNNIKNMDKFYKKGNTCKDCNNEKRRKKYNENENYRLKAIKNAIEIKHRKVVARQKQREEEIKKLEEEIGICNKICKYCVKIQPKEKFRKNRLKCKDCERDEPKEKFKRLIRTRIYILLRNKNKNKHTIDYLGCNYDEYFKWIFTINPDYNIENYGQVWHIDHVIPLSKFDLNDVNQQLIAFNWRNTTPLSSKENLSKNNKIITEQVKEHYNTLIEFHNNNNIELPKEFIELYATHSNCGKPP